MLMKDFSTTMYVLDKNFLRADRFAMISTIPAIMIMSTKHATQLA